MIIRIMPDSRVFVINHVRPENEQEWLEANAGNTQFRQYDGALPAATFNNYRWENNKVVVDEEAEAIEIQKQVNQQSRDELSNTDWKVIRELEKLYLSDTDLHSERQAIRDSITDV